MALPNGLPLNSDLGSLLGSLNSDLVTVPTIAAPFTLIQNRAPMFDLSKDLGTRWGDSRVQINGAYLMPNESGPNGELVYSAINDIGGHVRFCGNWTSFNQNGQGVFAGLVGDFVEISFYGTGLNLVTFSINANRAATITVDGIAAGTFTESDTSTSGVLVRNYNPNVIKNVVSNLALGFHTVRLTTTTSLFDVMGYEVINNSANILVNAGTVWKNGNKLYNPTAQTFAYNTNFESGTLGTRGGRVAVYLKGNGVIAKAVTPTNNSQANMASADHTNEEIARQYQVREFVAGRSDDFSGGPVNSNVGGRYFTLNDGSAALVSNTFFPVNNGFQITEGTGVSTTSDFITFTFIGTGLDVYQMQTVSNITANDTVHIDGNVISTGTAGNNWKLGITKIVSGLPYGTHTFRYTKTNAGSGAAFNKFIVYQPKTPTIPSDASMISSYNIMANFVANTTSGLLTTSLGVMRKWHTREMFYQNGTGGTADWSLGLTAFTSLEDALDLYTDRTGAYFEYTFWGTGFDMRGFAGSDNRTANQVTLQNLGSGGSLVNLTTANFATIATSSYGGWSFNSGTGVLNQQGAGQPGSGFTVSNLPLSHYKVRVTLGGGGTYLRMSTIDVITPVHSHKENGPFNLQNATPIGSQGIKDNRRFVGQARTKNISRAEIITANPSTSFTNPNPMINMAVTHPCETGKIRISWNVQSSNNTAGGISSFRTVVNGTPVSPDKNNVFQAGGAGTNVTTTENIVLNVGVGVHKVDIYWWTNTGLHYVLSGGHRELTVEDVD